MIKKVNITIIIAEILSNKLSKYTESIETYE